MKTYVHKLKFTDKESFDTWRKNNVSESIITIVEIGLITEVNSIDENPVFVDGWHVDILAWSIIESLNPYLIITDNPIHGYGWAEPDYEIVKPV